MLLTSGPRSLLISPGLASRVAPEDEEKKEEKEEKVDKTEKEEMEGKREDKK